MSRLLYAAATTPPDIWARRFHAATNSFIAVLLCGIVLLLVVLFGYYVAMDIRARKRDALRRKIIAATGRTVQAVTAGQGAQMAIADKKLLFNRGGVAVLAQVFGGLDEAGRRALRDILLQMGFDRYVAAQLKTDNEDYLVELVRLAGDLDLVQLDGQIAGLIPTFRRNVDLQFAAFYTLSRLGSLAMLEKIFMDERFVQPLSFRSLQQVLGAFNGDRQALYSRLIASPDHYVVRICIKRAGLEDMQVLADKIVPWLSSQDINIVIDAARALGNLRYRPAAPHVQALASHPRWEVRAVAISALAAIDKDPYEDTFVAALQDSEWQVRYNAGLVLRTFGDIDKIRTRVLATGDKYALDMLEYMAQTAEIWRQDS